ncbi:META domain-containing protein [Acinetobacter sp. WZC-1]|uniref:META domain-containing protein n=1 Tax=Acinetobacter sp. WZC-1 TaxID=3459034 RepID=UPI00403D6C8E
MFKKIIAVSLLGCTLAFTGCATTHSALQQKNLSLLQNKDWSMTHIGATEYANDPATHTATPSIRFNAASMQVNGSDGCNRMAGTYLIKDNHLELGPLATTRMYCEGKMELANKYAEALDTVTGYQVYGRTLKLLDNHGNPVLQFTHSAQIH